MRITARAAYACSAILELALHSGRDRVQAREIAEQNSIPVLFMEQILVQLRKAGLVGSVRGVSGGYFLARGPADITVWDVIQAIDGRQEFVETRNIDALLAEFWEEIQASIVAQLDSVTFEALVVRRQRAREIPDFQI